MVPPLLQISVHYNAAELHACGGASNLNAVSNMMGSGVYVDLGCCILTANRPGDSERQGRAARTTRFETPL